MADFGPTQLNATTQELWDTRVEKARYAKSVILNRVANKSDVAKKKGDIIHVAIDQKYSVGAVGSDGTFTPQNYTVGNSDITLNQWRQIAVQILDQASSQSYWSPDSTFPDMAGASFGAQYDADLAALHSSVTAGNIVGSTSDPSTFTAAQAREAVFKLANLNIPLDEVSFIIHPVSYYGGILTELQLTSAQMVGLPKNVLTTGANIPLLGLPTFTSTNIVEVAGVAPVKKNLLLHKSSLAIAWSKNNTVEKVRSTANLTLADLIVMQSVNGSAVIRSDHFAVINSLAGGTF